MLPFSLDCQFLIASSVFSNVYIMKCLFAGLVVQIPRFIYSFIPTEKKIAIKIKFL